MDKNLKNRVEASEWFQSYKPQLDHLRRFLHDNKATVMVGAGFSKNAKKAQGVEIKNWSELADDFYLKIFGKKPDKEDTSYRSALKLASQVSAQFGRNALDKIIENAVPIDKVKPGNLHTKLVNLPWKDIFTTNYDDLLERAQKTQVYSLVTDRKTILYKTSPRIIKLHGSIPNIKPYIIDEEDYRTYPEKYPEFVNTVRQSLIETALCLIGFSGDDPNFQSWLGWIRDKQGDDLNPIYLLSVSPKPYHESEISLFERRKIKIIQRDPEVFKSVEDFFNFIFDYLNQTPYFENSSKWDGKLNFNELKNKVVDYVEADGKLKKVISALGIDECISEYSKIRKAYPGWICIPRTLLYGFQQSLQSELSTFGSIFREIEENKKRILIYELLWRMEKSFTPIYVVSWLKDYIEELSTAVSLEEFNNIENSFIFLNLLSFYRRTNNIQKFQELSSKLGMVYDLGDSQLIDLYLYENCLFQATFLNYSKVKELLFSWDIVEGNYRGLIWKASIQNLIGESIEAKTSLSRAYKRLENEVVGSENMEEISSSMAVISHILSHYEIFNGGYGQNLTGNNLDFSPNELINDEKNKLLEAKEEIRDFNLSSFHVKHSFKLNSIKESYLSASFYYDGLVYPAARILTILESLGCPWKIDNINFYKFSLKVSLKTLAKAGVNELVIHYLINFYYKDIVSDILTKELVVNTGANYIEKVFNELYPRIYKFFSGSSDHGVNNNAIFLASNVLVRFSPVLKDNAIIKILHLMLKIRENFHNYFEYEALEILFDCLKIDSRKKVFEKLILSKLNVGTKSWITFPVASPFNVKETCFKFICQGLSSSDNEESNYAYIRAAQLFIHFSDDQKNRISNYIINWRNKVIPNSMNALYSFNLIPYDESRDNVDINALLKSAIKKLYSFSLLNKDSGLNYRDNALEIINQVEIIYILNKYIPKEECTNLLKNLYIILVILNEKELSDNLKVNIFNKNETIFISQISCIIINIIDRSYKIKKDLIAVYQNLANSNQINFFALEKLIKISANSISHLKYFNDLLLRTALSIDNKNISIALLFLEQKEWESNEKVWIAINNTLMYGPLKGASRYINSIIRCAKNNKTIPTNIFNFSELFSHLSRRIENYEASADEIFDTLFQLFRLASFLIEFNNKEEILQKNDAKAVLDWLKKMRNRPRLPKDVIIGSEVGKVDALSINDVAS